MTTTERSMAERIAQLGPEMREKILARLTDSQVEALSADWHFWARPKQLEPAGTEWVIWLILAGRGFGKTRTGAEFVLDRVEQSNRHNRSHPIALIGRTAADVRDVMIEGESGLAECAERRKIKMVYQPSIRRVTFPYHDAKATSFSAEEPESLRGPQHLTAWGDELAAWSQIVDTFGNTAFSNAMLGLRAVGPMIPRIGLTTTPKPVAIVRELSKEARDGSARVHMTTGSMTENRANLAQSFIAEVTARYKGTRLGAQEIDGLLVDEVEGAAFRLAWIEGARIYVAEHVPTLSLVVIGVDPGFSSSEQADETGIIVVGLELAAQESLRRHAYVLEDLSMRGTPGEWIPVVRDAYYRHGVNTIVVESNLGGPGLMKELFASVDQAMDITPVTAKADKTSRAGNAALMYEQGRVHHVGTFGALESEQITYVLGDKSPNRMDALVHGINHLVPDSNTRPAKTSARTLRQGRLPSTKPTALR